MKFLINSGAKYPEKLQRISNLDSLKYLVSKGASVDGLLNSTRNIEIIKYLIEECKQNLNTPFKGKYPLLILTNVDEYYSIHSRVVQYELIEDILNLKCEIDFTIIDEKARTLKERIDFIKNEYDKCIEKSPSLARK